MDLVTSQGYYCVYREHAPSIIFMDEIDSIGSSRLGGGSGGEDQHHVMKDHAIMCHCR